MTTFKKTGAVLALAVCMLLGATDAFATHFRYGTITTRPVAGQPNQVDIQLEMAFRRSYPNWVPTYPIVGNTVDVQVPFTISGTGYTTSTHNTILTIVSINEQEDWFVGRQTFRLTLPATANGQFTVRWEQCCRLSSLADGNNDITFRLLHTFSVTAGTVTNYGPVLSGLPIRYLAVNKVVALQLPGADPDGGTLTYRLATDVESGLLATRPKTRSLAGFPPSVNDPSFSLSATGLLAWTPTAYNCNPTPTQPPGVPAPVPINQACQYAIQIVATDGQGAAVPMDFLLDVQNPTGTPPVLTINGSSTPVSVTAIVGFAASFPLVATDANGGALELSVSSMPPLSAMTPSLPFVQILSPGQPLNATFTWTPGLGDSGPHILEFAATDATGNQTTNFVTVNVISPELRYLTGYIRDFPASGHPDFNRPDGDNIVKFVASQIGSDRKPVFAPTGSVAVTQFNTWYNNPPTEVFSVVANNGFNTNLDIFTYNASDFYRGDRYFTYEAHTWFMYSPGQILNYSSSDDLWIFVNGKLMVDLGGVHTTPKTISINMDTYAALNGLTAGQIYEMDIFYAHRGTTHASSVRIDLPDTPMCSAIGAPAATALPIVLGNAQAIAGATRILTSGLTTSGAVWTGAPHLVLPGFSAEFDFKIAPTVAGGGDGFAFVMQGEGPGARGSEGGNLGYAGITKSIAVEFDTRQDGTLSDPNFDHLSVHSRFAVANNASEQYSLGRSFNDLNLHTKTPFNINDGLLHHARVIYEPAPDNPSAPPGDSVGWLKIYLDNSNLPTLTVPIMQSQIYATFPDGTAYLGFTSGSSAATTANVDISNFTIAKPQVAGQLSQMFSQPQTQAPGMTGIARIFLRDACNVRIRTGGQSSLITATLVNALAPQYTTAVTVTDMSDGTYTLSYTPLVGGVWVLDVRVGGFPIVANPFQFVVTPATPTLTVVGSSGPYTGSPRIATATLKGVFQEVLPGPVTFTYNGQASAIDADSYAAVGTFPGNQLYAAATETTNVTITKVNPTVTTDTTTLTYNGLLRTATGVVKGVMGETLATPSFAYTPDPPVHVGTYAVAGTYAGNINYNPGSANGSLTISPATPTVVVTNVATTYDGNSHPTTATVNGVNGESFTTGVSFTYGGSPVPPTNAGTYPVIATFAAAGDYVTATGNGSVVIGKATPTVTVNSDSVTYDAAPHGVTASVTGVGGAPLGDADAITYGGSSTPPSDAGLYPVVATFAETTNYTAASGNGALTITAATPTLAVTPLSFVYDGNLHESAAVLTGVGGAVIPGAVSFTYDGAPGAPKDVKSYVVAASFAGAGNYGPASADGTLEITVATPTVIVNSGSFTFDGLAHGVTGTVTGIGGEVLGPLTFTYGGDNAEPMNAGTYVVVGSFAGGGNYGPATGNGSLVIDKAEATVTVQSDNVTYNGAPQGVTGTVTGINNTVIGTPALTYNGLPTPPTDANTYTVAGSFDGDANYNSASGVGTLTITPASATVQVVGGTFTYNGQQRPATVTVTGVNGANLGAASITYNGDAAVPVNAGNYAVNASYAATTNYGEASATGTILINRAPLTITADNKVMIQGAAVPALTASYAGFVNGETAAVLDVPVSLSTAATPASPLGTYPIVASGAADGNYAIGFVNGTLTVDPDITPGLMTGHGWVRDDDDRFDFEFLVRERANGSDRGRLEVRIKDEDRDRKGNKKKAQKKRDDRFVSRTITNIVFSDDPTIRPGRSRKPQIDTVKFAGIGEWNGRGGYRFEAFAQDMGEPGRRHSESISITIFDSNGNVVAQVEGELDGGNIQSARIRH